MEENLIKVYVQVDSNNVITSINSDIFLTDTTGYIQIDEGTGDKYAHAQGNYFTIDDKKPLKDSNGKCNYKLIDNKPIELTEEEKEKLFPEPTPEPTKEELLQKQLLETQGTLANLQEQILLQNGGK